MRTSKCANCARCGARIATAASKKAEAAEAQNHHHPGGCFRDSRSERNSKRRQRAIGIDDRRILGPLEIVLPSAWTVGIEKKHIRDVIIHRRTDTQVIERSTLKQNVPLAVAQTINRKGCAVLPLQQGS